MSFINGARVRKLLPASAVAAVLAIAYMSPLPADASKVNNCGVKGGYAIGGYGYAFHDHGKPCPNRPFPGKGEGLEKFLGGAATANASNTNTTTEVNTNTTTEVNESSTTEDNDSSTSGGNPSASSVGKAHGHGNGNGHSKGH